MDNWFFSRALYGVLSMVIVGALFVGCGSEDSSSVSSSSPPNKQEGWNASLLTLERQACVEAVVDNSVSAEAYCVCVYEDISTTYTYEFYYLNVISILDEMLLDGRIATCVQKAKRS